MAVTRGDRAIFDLKRWEFCAPAPTATVTGSFVASSPTHEQAQMYVAGNTSAWLYFPFEDSWVDLPSPALGGTFGGGAAGYANAYSVGNKAFAVSPTATGGSTVTINTDLPLARDLRGYKIQILEGPNAGELKTIASNTVGSNSTITFTSASASSFTTANKFILRTPVWWVIGSGTLVTSSFRRYDFATDTWLDIGVSGQFSFLWSDGRLAGSLDYAGTELITFESGTVTSSGSGTLTDTSKSWTTDAFVGMLVWIISGTGAGQAQTVSTNNNNTLSLSSSFSIQPDTTSTYAIRPDVFKAYYVGSLSNQLKIHVGNGFWVNSSGLRSGATGAGCSLDWAWNPSSGITNARYLYSVRGGGVTTISRFDTWLGTWEDLPSSSGETFTGGTKSSFDGKYLYVQKDTTGRWLRYDAETNEMTGWGSILYPQGNPTAGNASFLVTHKDGATTTKYVHMILNSSTVHLRQMVI